MNYLHEYLSISDKANVFDNSGKHVILVLTKRDGKFTLSKGAESIEWVKEYILPYFRF
mgnify:CR=1 FL=1